MGRKDIYKDAKPFKKNDPRINRKGAPIKIPEIDEACIRQLLTEEDGKTKLDQIIAKVIKKALDGDMKAVQEILDRSFGKARQYMDHTSKGDKIQPLNITVANTDTGNELSKLIEHAAKSN